jgi:cyanophycinase-like exopeptidase
MFGISSSRIVHAVMSHPHADIPKAKEILESADIVFVSGGDVNAGMNVLREKNMLDFLGNLYDSGKLFFGTSAGAIMLANEWVRWPDPEDASSAELFPCLGFAPVICDCHDEESGWEELKAALELNKNGTKGYGLAAGAAVKVSPTGDIKVLSGTVHPHIRSENGINRLPDMLS